MTSDAARRGHRAPTAGSESQCNYTQAAALAHRDPLALNPAQAGSDSNRDGDSESPRRTYGVLRPGQAARGPSGPPVARGNFT